MTEKLKPCPFCGGKAKLQRDVIGLLFKPRLWYSVRCSWCEISTVKSNSRDFVIECWNRRAEVKGDA